MLKKFCALRKATACLPMLLLAQIDAAPAGAEGIWVADDKTRTIYELTLDGELLTSFRHVKGASSGIDVDPLDGTLWGADDAPSRIAHFTRTGDEIAFFMGDVFGAVGAEGVGADRDGSLWVVDDPGRKTGLPAVVMKITREGHLLGSFPTETFDPASTSPQAIAVDPFDGTLWVTDNASSSVYNVSTRGRLLALLPSELFDAAAQNLQGISVDASNGTLWVTSRDTGTIYNVSRRGELISSFPSTVFDPASLDPTGVAFDLAIGDASDYAGLGDLEMLADDLHWLSHLDEHFAKAARTLEHALDPRLWAGEDTLTRHGKRVYDGMKGAVKALHEVDSAFDAADRIGDGLVSIAANLAEIAIADAIAVHGDRKEIEKAKREFHKGLEALAKGRPDKAIDKFGKAWQHAFKAAHKRSDRPSDER